MLTLTLTLRTQTAPLASPVAFAGIFLFEQRSYLQRVSATLYDHHALVKRAPEQSNLAPVLNKGTYSERFNTSESRSESEAQESGIIIDSKRTPADPTGKLQWSSETPSQSSAHTKYPEYNFELNIIYRS